ncbi:MULTISPECIES: hypothetical protein [unclassified Streptomyces]|uniref:hypothetical protein n=1 Tax=unclassified Streptomyces TaxID=2593676 RepID=UPI0038270395
MSGGAPVDPAEIPVFTGDLAVLDEKVKLISSGGATVSTKASDVHTSFGGLQAFYQAPEADQLFATTKPVQDLGLKLSSDMCTIAGALGTYSRDAAPIIKKLENLKAEAEAFREKTDKEDKWAEDGGLIDENLERRNKIAEVWAQFQDVETAAHAKIVALVDGTPLKKDDGSHGAGMYGYDAEMLKASKSLPWGDAVEESTPGWQVWEHVWEFGKGFFVDGVWGTLKGLGGLVGLQGWDTFKQSWTGLAKLSTGLGIAMIPGAGAVFMALPDDKLPSWLRDSRTAMKETGKALLAWDQWGSNPGRAAGAATFNVITAIATRGGSGAVAGAGKASLVAKTLSLAGKTGSLVDPMTYIIKGAGAGISKAGDIMAALKGMGKVDAPAINVDGAFALPEGAVKLPDGAIQLPSGAAVPDGAIKLSDGTIKLPEGTTTFPPGTVKLPVDGAPQFMDPKGNIYDADGAITQHAKDAPKGQPDAGADVPRTDAPKADSPATVKVPKRELAGVGGRGGDDAIRLGSDISDPVHAIDTGPRGGAATPVRIPEHELAGVGGRGGDHTPGGHAPDNMPRNSVDNPAGGSGGPGREPLNDGGHSQTPPASGAHPEGPGGAGHSDGPGGSGHTDGLSTGGPQPDVPGGAGVTDDGVPSGAADDAGSPPEGSVPDGATPGSEVEPVPMPRGGDLEQGVRDAVKGIPGASRPKPPVFERVLEVLGENPRGHQVAEIIASGRFNGSENFGQVVSSLGAKKVQMAEPGIDQIILADDLARSGFAGDRIDFEIKNDAGGDADVRLLDDNGNAFVYQMKRLNNPLDPVSEITRGKNLGQLTHSVGDHRIMLVDGQGSVAKWTAEGAVERLMEIHQNGRGRFEAGKDVTFVIRLDDGTLVVPPGSKTDPKDML